ncbi:hypothetical protein MBLNU230_g7284t1 [Neophaeotheca triangularis]
MCEHTLTVYHACTHPATRHHIHRCPLAPLPSNTPCPPPAPPSPEPEPERIPPASSDDSIVGFPALSQVAIEETFEQIIEKPAKKVLEPEVLESVCWQCYEEGGWGLYVRGREEKKLDWRGWVEVSVALGKRVRRRGLEWVGSKDERFGEGWEGKRLDSVELEDEGSEVYVMAEGHANVQETETVQEPREGSDCRNLGSKGLTQCLEDANSGDAQRARADSGESHYYSLGETETSAVSVAGDGSPVSLDSGWNSSVYRERRAERTWPQEQHNSATITRLLHQAEAKELERWQAHYIPGWMLDHDLDYENPIFAWSSPPLFPELEGTLASTPSSLLLRSRRHPAEIPSPEAWLSISQRTSPLAVPARVVPELMSELSLGPPASPASMFTPGSRISTENVLANEEIEDVRQRELTGWSVSPGTPRSGNLSDVSVAREPFPDF